MLSTDLSTIYNLVWYFLSFNISKYGDNVSNITDNGEYLSRSKRLDKILVEKPLTMATSESNFVTGIPKVLPATFQNIRVGNLYPASWNIIAITSNFWK